MALERNLSLESIESIITKRHLIHRLDYFLKSVRVKEWHVSICKILEKCERSKYDISDYAKPFLKKYAQSICTVNEYFEKRSICVQMYWCTDDDMRWAVKNGAYIVVTTKQIDHLPCIITDNPLLLYAELCNYYRNLHKVCITEVIGSIGKTTTKRMIHSVLSTQYKTLSNPTNRNLLCHVGYDVQHIPRNVERVIEEVSEDTPGYAKYSSIICKPNNIIITSIDFSHFEAFGSQQAIAEEICSVTHDIDNDAIVIVNKDEFKYFDLIKRGRIVTVSIKDATADFYATNINIEQGGLRFDIVDSNGHYYKVNLNNIYATHNVLISLYAFATGIHEGISPSQIIQGLKSYKQLGIRQNVFRTEDDIIIYADCYNAVTKSIASAIDAAEMIPLYSYKTKPRRIAVLGDVAETGDLLIKTHKDIIEYVNNSSFDVLITYGDNLKNAAKELNKREDLLLYTCDNHEQVEKEIRQLHLTKGDLILFKSSHSGHLEKVMLRVFPETKMLITEEKQIENKWRKTVIMS